MEIALITLTGVFFFKEKLNTRQIFAIALITVAVILLNWFVIVFS